MFEFVQVMILLHSELVHPLSLIILLVIFESFNGIQVLFNPLIRLDQVMTSSHAAWSALSKSAMNFNFFFIF